MLSDEEKKALKELTEIKELVEEDLKYEDYNVTATLDQIDLESLVIVLNLIEKQSKEIEGLIKVSKECIKEKFNNDKKWEDKIKAKIEEVKKYSKEHGYLNMRSELDILQSLLEKE